MISTERSEDVVNFAKKFLSPTTWYVWGGNHRITGMDCSGFMKEVLWFARLDTDQDETAQMIYNRLERQEWRSYLDTGALIFYGKDRSHITHIAMALDKDLIIESGGGNSGCKTIQDAKKIDAKVRKVLIKNRNDIVAIIMPDYRRG